MDKKKGFTLIELLAVLVILAIILVIAMPTLVRVINKTEKKGVERSLDGYARAVESAAESYLAKNPSKSKPTKLSMLDIENDGVSVECDDEFEWNENGSIRLYDCKVSDDEEGDYYTYSDGKMESSGNSVVYNKGTKINYNGMDFYVLKKSPKSQEYVTLFSYYPIRYNDVSSSLSSADVPRDSYYQSGDWIYASYSYGPNCVSGGNLSSDCRSMYELSNVKTIVDIWAKVKLKDEDLVKVNNYKTRLISVDDLISNYSYKSTSGGCDTCNSYYIIDTSSKNYVEIPSWLRNYSTWTMSQFEESNELVYYLEYSQIYSTRVYYENTIRPVINVKKSVLQEGVK